jgi:polyisoprenoid-binding protein YceI
MGLKMTGANPMQSKLQILSALAAWLLFAPLAQADWQLVNANSRLSFMSIKKGEIAEQHYFKQLQGTVDAAGQVKIDIDLATVDTKIPIRDERMRNDFFETKQYPKASLSGQFDMAKLAALPVGESAVHSVQFNLDLHGIKRGVFGDIVLARLAADKILVTSHEPFVLGVRDFNLAAGLDKLREIAGLPSISPTVPVSFALTFVEKK